MSYWPQPTIFPAHQLTIGSMSPCGMYANIGVTTKPASGTLGSALRMFAYPFRLTRPMTVQRAWWMNGATVAGNVIIGIYGSSPGVPSADSEVKLAETASTAMSGTNTLQSAAIGPIYLTPGSYHAAFIADSATAAYFRGTILTLTETRHLGYIRITQGGFSLPTTLGSGNQYQNAVILFGLATQTVI